MKKLFALGLLLATSLAFAVPTQFGFSGGFTVPNAEIQQGVTLTMTVDPSEDTSGTMGPIAFAWSDKLPKTQLSFSVGKSLEFCLGYHKRELGVDFLMPPGGYFTKANPFSDMVMTYSTTNLSVKYALPYTIGKGKFAIGAQYDTTDLSVEGDGPGPDGSSINRWVGLLCGTFPVFDNVTTFTPALMFVTGDTDKRTSFGVNLERQLPNKGAVGVEYITNSPNDYLNNDGDFGTVYATIPFGDMFTGRLAITGINQEAKLAYSLTAKF